MQEDREDRRRYNTQRIETYAEFTAASRAIARDLAKSVAVSQTEGHWVDLHSDTIAQADNLMKHYSLIFILGSTPLRVVALDLYTITRDLMILGAEYEQRLSTEYHRFEPMFVKLANHLVHTQETYCARVRWAS